MMMTIWVLTVTTLMTNGTMVIHKEVKEPGHYQSREMCESKAKEINYGARGGSLMSDIMNEQYKKANYKGSIPRMWPQYEVAECSAREIEKPTP